MPIPKPGDLFDFSQQTVMVTGAGSGIGAGIALRFAEAGASVAVHYHSSDAGANQVITQIEKMGRKAIAVQGDLTRRADSENLFAQTVEAFGDIHVLVNNAGIYPGHTLLDMTDDDWDLVVDASLRSTYICTQLAARHMIERKISGAIVNMASIEAQNPAPMHAHYNAAKAGVVMFTKSAASELGPHGIRVNVVSPGLIWAEGIETSWPDGVERWQKSAPLTRLGQPDDVADACLFFASPAARWITGAELLVDGGVMTKQIF
jgi:NAD(P)-dependent dehydrogenase (short-subunit alcohol dehydrogenase family)